MPVGVGMRPFIVYPPASGDTLWTPSQITTTAWYDASDTTTITESGGAVSQLSDKSTNNYHATQVTAAKQPTTGTRTINGLNVLDFDGTDDSLAIAHSALYSIPATCYLFTVAQLDGSTANAIICASQSLNRKWGLDLDTDGTDTLTIRSGSSQRAIGTAGTLDLAIWAQEADGAGNLKARKSGNLIYDGTPSAADATSDNLHIGSRVGTGNYFDGIIAEIIRIDSSIDTDTRYRIEGYLANKWGFEDNLPVGHPYKSSPPMV